MRSHRRPALSAAAAVLALTLAACGATTTPSEDRSTPPVASATAAPTPDLAGAAAYSAAICPIFDAILTIDPRLADIRAAGSAGGDMTVHDAELGSLSDDIRVVLNDLEAVPDWEPGRRLQFELTSSLHVIRAELLAAARDTAAPEAAEAMAALPFLASVTMDRAMAAAVEGGMACPAGS